MHNTVHAMIIILPISINLILCILLFIVYCVHVLYVRFDMCKINDSQSVIVRAMHTRRAVKISQHLSKLLTQVEWHVFIDSQTVYLQRDDGIYCLSHRK